MSCVVFWLVLFGIVGGFEFCGFVLVVGYGVLWFFLGLYVFVVG